MAAQDLLQKPAIRRFRALLDSLDQPHDRSITGSGTSGVIPVIHRYTPHQDRMPCSFFRYPPLKLPVPNTIGELRTTGATKPPDVRKAHPLP
jgi:hypothetical protein